MLIRLIEEELEIPKNVKINSKATDKDINTMKSLLKRMRYEINDDGTISTDSSVFFIHHKIERIPVYFDKVTWDFNVGYSNLRSMDGFPKHVGGNLDCSMNKIESLDGLPETIGENIDISNNDISSLIGIPKEVNGYFDCSKCKLTSLEGGPEKVKWRFDMSYNHITSLEYGPKYVGGEYICVSNDLESLEGCPTHVDTFNCSYNKLYNLRGCPTTVDGDFYCTNNEIDFEIEYVQKSCPNISGEIVVNAN